MPFATPLALATDMRLAGTPLPQSEGPITAANITSLTRVGQWGLGQILALAYSADGRSFYVASPFGFATYRLTALGSPPLWQPFQETVVFEGLSTSEDGLYLLLESPARRQTVRISDGAFLNSPPAGTTWLPGSSSVGPDGVPSPDGRWRLQGRSNYSEDPWIEVSVGEVVETASGAVVSTLAGETTYVHYSDRNEPEGCDLNSFSMCGNVYEPSAMTLYRAAFSPAGEPLAVLYRAPNLYNSNEFSVLRLYRPSTGELLATIGSFGQPVQDFAFAPEGRTLLIGLVDGSIQLFDLVEQRPIFTTRDFSAPSYGLEFSADDEFIYLFGPSGLEIRRARDGAFLGRYAASAFGAHPTEVLIALGETSGRVRVLSVRTRETIWSAQAHSQRVFAVAFSQDGQWLASSGQDCRVRIWDADTGEFHRYLEPPVVDAYEMDGTESRAFVQYLFFPPGLDQLIGMGSWGTVVSWSIPSGETQFVVEPQALEYYLGMVTLNPHFPTSFSVDLERAEFYVGERSYDITTGQSRGEYQPPVALPEWCGAFFPLPSDPSITLSHGYWDREGQMCVLDSGGSRLLAALQIIPLPASRDVVVDWYYPSPDGSRLLINTWNGAVLVYQVTP